MRLFVAIDLDDGARKAIAQTQQRIAESVETDRSLKWVNPAHMHLTLAFLGEVAEPAVPAIVTALSVDIDARPFTAVFQGFGVFPPRGAPRVLWVGVGPGASDMIGTQQVVAARVADVGVTLERRPFHPHLTLARWRKLASERRAKRPLGWAGNGDRKRERRSCHAVSKPPDSCRPGLYRAGACYPDVMPTMAILVAYGIGSTPFAWLLARRWGASDLRRVGSGNVGAANVFRASGVTAGVLVAVLDVAKGAASVVVADRLGGGAVTASIAGMAAIVGHIYPVWLHFRGGKGVATACGVFAVLTPAAVLPALAVFFSTVWLTKYVSLGSVLATLALPPIAYATGSPVSVVVVACVACALIVFRHRSNVARLRSGTERRLGVRA